MGVPDLDAALRHFWHPVCSLDELAGAAPHPLAVRLLGTRWPSPTSARRARRRAWRSPTGARTARRDSRWAGSTTVALRCANHGWCFDGERTVHRHPVARPTVRIPERAAVWRRSTWRSRTGWCGCGSMPACRRRCPSIRRGSTRAAGARRRVRTRGPRRRPVGSRTSSTSRTSPGCTTARLGRRATSRCRRCPTSGARRASCASSSTRRSSTPSRSAVRVVRATGCRSR